MPASPDDFQHRVYTAAVAAWRVVLLGVGLLIVSWLAYLLVIRQQPAWFLSLWGPDLTWSFVQQVWFWGIVTVKIIVWLIAMAALWLTLWARQLRR